MISILVQFVLIVWAIVSFFIGLTKVVIASGISSLTITLTLGIPLLIIIFFSLKIYRNYSKTKVELRKIKDASEICKKWAFSFPFVSQNNTQFKLYLRKGSPAGKIIITDVTKEQATELYSEKTNLPSGILLEVYTKSENDGDFIH
ncbi:hypothetical protein [Paenibacillus sp. W4I10]|uniref:hypothetical protein n=1 Tax=Paenibacillus sp. W4I10 TaxID=3042298 RepID=UPI0027D8B631|nr:hypothetical protein [Paenibacillus sp. W4I10]